MGLAAHGKWIAFALLLTVAPLVPIPGRAASAGSSGGATVTLTFSGTVIDSYDPGGIFGCTENCGGIGNDTNPYKGYTYKAVYVFNTGIGELITNPGIYVALSGGSLINLPSPLISDSVTISNGASSYSYSMDRNYYGLLQVSQADLNYPPYPADLVAEVIDANSDVLSSEIVSFDIPFSITTPFGPTDFGAAAGSVLNFDCGAVSCAGFVEADMTVSETVSVPEPATWSLIGLGFLGLGCFARRRAAWSRAAV